MAKIHSKPKGLRALLTVVLILIILGGAGLFYLGLNMVKEYSLEVNHRLIDAEASGTQIQQLQALRSQLDQSESLITKADRLFASPSNYQAQSLNDLKNYANQTGLTIASTNFGDPSSTGVYSVTVKLGAPVSYSKLIKFLELIEGNLPKMQVASMSLTHQTGGGSDSVDVGDIKINISVR